MNRQSDLNRTKRADSLRKVALDQLREVPRAQARGGGEVGLRAVVEEVVKYLMEIVEALLQEENSENYRSFLAAAEAMHRELERKMLNTVAERCSELRCELIDRLDQL